MKLGVKLIGGFLVTGLIILTVGLFSILQQNALQSEVEKLGNQSIPAVENILVIKSQAAAIASLMRSLLTPYATNAQRTYSHEHLLESRKIYGAAKEAFAALPLLKQVEGEWQDFNTNIAKWVKVNNQAVELSSQLITLDITKPDQMKQHMADFEITHTALLAKLGRLLLFGTPFEGGTGDQDCVLGKWMERMDTTNADMVALVGKLKPIHSQLHKNVARIKDLAAKGEITEAKEFLEKEIYPASDQIFALVREMKKITDNANEKFVKMNQLLLEEGEQHQVNTFAAIDKIVEKAESTASSTVASAKARADRGRWVTLACLVAGISLALVLGLVLTRSITRPLQQGVHLARAMASGDLTQNMDVRQEDEIGVLARSLNEMTTNLRRMFTDISQGVATVGDSSLELTSISRKMSEGAEATAGRSAQVSAAAEQMSANQNSVAAAMEQASVNVNMVAAAAEEMKTTIGNIAGNSEKAKEITASAVEQSQKASARVNDLGRAADEINKVTEAITEISEQTNLLALNATIEAARAGEAGKGFAVVANEIKDLAKQTALATLDIKNKIHSIQEATGVTVTEINEISTVIADVDRIVASIATAVSEQSATTGEIAQNVHQASQGIAEVNENVSQSSIVATEIAGDIAAVNSSAGEMSASSQQVRTRAEELSTVADRLREMVARFTL